MLELPLTHARVASIPLTRVRAEKFEACHRLLIEVNARFELTRARLLRRRRLVSKGEGKADA